MSRRQRTQPLKSQIEVPWDPRGDLSLQATTASSTQQVSLSEIHLRQQQPRRYFDPQALKELIDSVKTHGLLQPLLVRPLPSGGYELVAGERRYRAATECSLTEVPVVVRELSDDMALQLSLIENLQREDLNPVEETSGILALLALRLETEVEEVKSLLYRMKNSLDTLQKESGDEGGQSRRNVSPNSDEAKAQVVKEVFERLGGLNWLSFTTSRLPLLNLPDEILAALLRGQIAYTKARALARVKDDKERGQLLGSALANNWSLSQIKEQLKEHTIANKTPKEPSALQLSERLKAAYQKVKKSRIVEEPKKQKQLEALIVKLEALLDSD